MEAARRVFPMRRTDETVTARAIRTRDVCHTADVLGDPEYQQKDTARVSGYRGCLGVPMVRDEQVVGAIFVARRQPGLFSDTQVQLLKTFADQAVIAIENVRLFNETSDFLAAADRHRRRPQNHQPVDFRFADSAANPRGISGSILRCRQGEHYSRERWRLLYAPRRTATPTSFWII